MRIPFAVFLSLALALPILAAPVAHDLPVDTEVRYVMLGELPMTDADAELIGSRSSDCRGEGRRHIAYCYHRGRTGAPGVGDRRPQLTRRNPQLEVRKAKAKAKAPKKAPAKAKPKPAPKPKGPCSATI